MRNVESIEVGYGEALQFGVSQGTYYKEPEQLLTEAYEAGKREQADELEAARAEIERLENQVQARDAELWGRTQKILQLEQQLADEQAKNVGLRELVEHFALIDLGRSLLPDDFGLWVLRARKALSTPDDLSSLRAHDAAIWREAMQIAEDSRDKATMSKYSSVPECRAARDMAECLSKAYCHKADAIEKGGE